MKRALFFLLLVSQLSYAEDCSISHFGFFLKDKKVESILENKGYRINYSQYKYRVKTEFTTWKFGGRTEFMFFFRKGTVNPLVQNATSFGKWYQNFEKAEKEFLMSLPNCLE